MKVLVVHNRYQQPGGEDQVFLAETALLESYGHQVVRCSTTIGSRNEPVTLAGTTLWNSSTYQELRDLIHLEQPDVAPLP